MEAYTAVISLLQTLEQRNIELIQAQTAEAIESLHATAEYFQYVLEKARNKSRFDPEKVKSLEEKIRVAASYAEDVVELKICQIIEGSSWTFGILQHDDLLPVVEKMDTTKKEVIEIVSSFSSTDDADDDKILTISRDSLIGTSSTSNSVLPCVEDVVAQGLDDDLEIIVKGLKGPPSGLDIVTITGMGGIGKTTLAKKAYDHLSIRYHFDIFVWVTISQEFRSRNVLLQALHCISKQTIIVKARDYDKIDDNELADIVQKNLKVRRYLVVVDDIWSTDVWDSIRGIFPDCNNKSRILLTTRETEVALYANTSRPHEINLLNLENGWKLLCDKVFGPKNDHPREVEEIGKKIVMKCQGLPLTILVVAGHLSKMVPTLESWKNVSQTLGEIVASHPDKCLAVLGLSYHHLPDNLKPCFLFMGGYPEDFQVETGKLIQLWIAEGFIRISESGKRLEEDAIVYLEDLISRNLIMVRKRRFNGEVKTCAMHDLLREFCLIEVERIKFMHVERFELDVPTLPTQKHNVRRFSFQTQNYSVENCYKLLPPVARSIYLFSELDLPFGTKLLRILPIYRCHPVTYEFFSRFNLLRVLAIFHKKIGFHSFPLVITKLSYLRYLEVRLYINDIPESISELQNLQTLIIHRYKHKYTTLPTKIWLMKNLRHINLGGGSYLPSPREGSISNNHLVIGMPNLEQISILCYNSCTNEVFSRIPNLKKLIMSVHYNQEDYLANRLIDMSNLTKLEVLKCYCSRDSQLNSIKSFVFPISLKKLTLTWFQFPWEDISTLSMLPNLEELKIVFYAIGNHEWILSDKYKFKRLKLLSLIGRNLERWEASSDSFPTLTHLILKYCNDLKEIPIDLGEICTLELIELYNCNNSAEDSARKIEQEQVDMGNNCLKVYIHSNHMRN